MHFGNFKSNFGLAFDINFILIPTCFLYNFRLKGLGINANDTFMMDFHREIFFLDFFRFRQSFSFRTLPQKNVLFFIFAVLGGCEDDLYISPPKNDF